MLVRRAADATCLQDLSTRPACGRPTQREDAAPKSPEASIHVPSRRRRTRGGLCDVAPVSEERTPTGALRRRADAAARDAPNPVRQSARLAETAIARETAARRRRGGPGSLSLSLSLSPLSVDRRDGAPSSSSKRSARVQLCWDITQRGAAAAAAATYLQRITFAGLPGG